MKVSAWQRTCFRYTGSMVGEKPYCISSWRLDHNHVRPHSSQEALTPIEFAQQQGGLAA